MLLPLVAKVLTGIALLSSSQACLVENQGCRIHKSNHIKEENDVPCANPGGISSPFLDYLANNLALEAARVGGESLECLEGVCCQPGRSKS